MANKRLTARILWWGGLALNTIGIYTAATTSGETLSKGGTLIGSTVIPTRGFTWLSAALLVLIGAGCWIAAGFIQIFQDQPPPRNAVNIIRRIFTALVVIGTFGASLFTFAMTGMNVFWNRNTVLQPVSPNDCVIVAASSSWFEGISTEFFTVTPASRRLQPTSIAYEVLGQRNPLARGSYTLSWSIENGIETGTVTVTGWDYPVQIKCPYAK